MNSKPDPDDQTALREALQRDAGRVQEPPFEAALHDATMRRIRALRDTGRALPEWGWMSTAAAGAAVLVLGALFAWWPSGPSERDATSKGDEVEIWRVHPPRATAWNYQRAAAQSDEALLAMLDRDARTLLPPSSPIFSNLTDLTSL